MAGYVKIWTNIRHDEWFISLRLNERGMWYELLSLAKERGDTGRFFARSRVALSHDVGADDSTSTRILGKFRQDGKIKLRDLDNGTLEIFIPKYRYWQELTSEGVKERVAKNRRKASENSPLPDQTRPDQTKELDTPCLPEEGGPGI